MMIRRTGWGGQTLLAVTQEPSDDLLLGQKIHSIDVRCTVKSNQSRWCHQTPSISSTHLCGLLYFNLEFKQKGRPRLMSADVDVAIFEDATETIPVAITATAPYNTLIPDDAPVHERWKSSTKTFEPALEAQGFMAKLGALSREKGATYQVEQAWSFASGQASDHKGVNRAEFNWQRDSAEDMASLRRSYDGALVFRRKSREARPGETQHIALENQSVVLSVGVSVSSKRGVYPLPTRRKRRQGEIGTASGKCLDVDDFDDLIEENALQARVLESNCLRGPTRIPSSTSASLEAERLKDKTQSHQRELLNSPEDIIDRRPNPILLKS